MQYFKDGAVIGAFVGTLGAVYYRKVMMVPKVSLAAGAAFGSVMVISQLYRHEI